MRKLYLAHIRQLVGRANVTANDPRQSPLTQRGLKYLLWGLSFATALVWVDVVLAYRQHLADREINAWAENARANAVRMQFSLNCDVPWLREYTLFQRLMGQLRVHVVAVRDEDVQAILDLPECPIPVFITTLPAISDGAYAMLQNRFGSENVD